MRLKDYLVRGKLPKLEESGRFEQFGKKTKRQKYENPISPQVQQL